MITDHKWFWDIIGGILLLLFVAWFVLAVVLFVGLTFFVTPAQV